MDLITDLFTSNGAIFSFFFKIFAIVMSFLYLIYALVLVRQTRQMLLAIEEEGGGIIRFISFLQILIAIVLIIASFAIM